MWLLAGIVTAAAAIWRWWQRAATQGRTGAIVDKVSRSSMVVTIVVDIVKYVVGTLFAKYGNPALETSHQTREQRPAYSFGSNRTAERRRYPSRYDDESGWDYYE